MKMLISTKETQGQRSNDFCWSREGELVKFGFQCDVGHIDDECGCRRCVSGIDSKKGTTTFLVAELDDAAVTAAMDAASISNYDRLLVAGIAERFPVGTILERRGTLIRPRRTTKREVLR